MLRSPEEEFLEAAEAEISAAFAGRLSVRLPEAARILRVGEKALRRHASQGSITFVDLGHGRRRRRRDFTRGDLVAFLASRRLREAHPVPRRSRRAGAEDDNESFGEFADRIARERGEAVTTAKRKETT